MMHVESLFCLLNLSFCFLPWKVKANKLEDDMDDRQNKQGFSLPKLNFVAPNCFTLQAQVSTEQMASRGCESGVPWRSRAWFGQDPQFPPSFQTTFPCANSGYTNKARQICEIPVQMLCTNHISHPIWGSKKHALQSCIAKLHREG